MRGFCYPYSDVIVTKLMAVVFSPFFKQVNIGKQPVSFDTACSLALP
jgi:hypothetical protein